LALQATAQTVGSLGFLTGTWEGGGFEETWGPGKAGTMLGTCRAVEDGKTVHTEFMLLQDADDSCTLTLHLPKTGKTMVFQAVFQHGPATTGAADGQEVQFVMGQERLTYRLEGDLMHIKLEKPKGGFELTLKRVR
jgi:hypothetical protein